MEVDNLSSTTACQVIDKLKGHFGRYGIPLQLVSDNAPQFSPREFKRFAQLWKFEHATSSPMYPRSNGMAEAGVKLAKNTLRKTMTCGGDVNLALLELRNTLRQDAGMSPAKMMFGRQTHSLLPTAVATEDNETVKVKKAKRRQSVKKHHDKTAQSLEELHKGQPIYYKPLPEARWKRGVIHKKLDVRSYIAKDTNGNTYRRNRVHIRRSTSQPDVTTAMPRELLEAKEDNTCFNNHPESGYNTYKQVPVTTTTTVTTPVTGARSPRNARSAVTTPDEQDPVATRAAVTTPATGARSPRNASHAVTTPAAAGRPTRNRDRPIWMQDYDTD